VIKSGKMRWVSHAARMKVMKNPYNILVWRLEGKRQLGRYFVDGKIILK